VAQPLTVPEIDRLVRGFAELGFWRVRLTGGEPTLRKDILEIVARVAATPGVRHVGMTTNGYRLKTLARDLAEAGLNCLNVSVDSLDPVRFASITGCSRLEDVVGGVEAAIAAGIPRIKVNAVLLAGTDGAALDRFLAWARDAPLAIRFIELMETGGDPAFFARNHVPAAEMERLLAERGWTRLPRAEGEGPAAEYGHPGHRGRIGIIAPYEKGFCKTCNRLRVSASGNLKLCLFADREVPLRHLLRSDEQREELVAAIRTAVGAKPASHHLDEGRVGNVRNLASIGGCAPAAGSDPPCAASPRPAACPAGRRRRR
jgi:cyclic pyranopterin phosphate synthase